ncbi:hypothetical protein HHX47_DHR1000351, partial [Lentinula edodes]
MNTSPYQSSSSIAMTANSTNLSILGDGGCDSRPVGSSYVDLDPQVASFIGISHASLNENNADDGCDSRHLPTLGSFYVDLDPQVTPFIGNSHAAPLNGNNAESHTNDNSYDTSKAEPLNDFHDHLPSLLVPRAESSVPRSS